MTRIPRLPSPTEDRGSLPLAMMVIVVGMLLGGLVGTLVMAQVATTKVDVRRVHALHAAQAGLDVAVGHIRAIADSEGEADRKQLPCTALTGALGDGSTAVYRVTIRYYLSDPQGRSESWLTANRLRCNAGAGLGAVPGYALLVSTGADSATTSFTDVPTRVLNGTYTFKIDNTNVTGGLIHVAPTGGGRDLCMDAGSGTPAANTPLTMQLCTPGAVQQTFAYKANLTISLVSSRSGSTPLGMCLDAGTPQKEGNPVVFQACAATTAPRQQWSFDDSSNLRGTTNGRTINSFCIKVQQPNTPGSFVIINTSCATDQSTRVFRPESSVGAGAAGSTSSQLVNYRQFGRCLDVTNKDVNLGYLIAWPCKQSPDQSLVTWNQKFQLPALPAGLDGEEGNAAEGAIMTKPSTNYCLRSPGVTTAKAYVTVVACPVPLSTNTTWKVYGETDAYATSYRIVDGFGLCLQPQDQNASNPDYFAVTNKVMKLFVARCDGSTLQKWNAEANKVEAVRLKDVGEK